VPRNEAYFAPAPSYSATEVRVFDTRSFTLLRTIPIPLPTTTSYVTTQQFFRFGATGLILNSSAGLKFMTIGI